MTNPNLNNPPPDDLDALLTDLEDATATAPRSLLRALYSGRDALAKRTAKLADAELTVDAAADLLDLAGELDALADDVEQAGETLDERGACDAFDSREDAVGLLRDIAEAATARANLAGGAEAIAAIKAARLAANEQANAAALAAYSPKAAANLAECRAAVRADLAAGKIDPEMARLKLQSLAETEADALEYYQNAERNRARLAAKRKGNPPAA